MEKIEFYQKEFQDSLEDDLNMPKALAVVWEVLKSNIPSEDKYDLIISFDQVLGLGLDQIQETELEIPKNIKTLINQRDKLRKEGKWQGADQIRNKITCISLNHFSISFFKSKNKFICFLKKSSETIFP